MFKSNIFSNYALQKVSLVHHIDYPVTFFYPIVQGCSKVPNLNVKVNQSVSSGDILARANQHGTQNIHSAVGGVVKNIRTFCYAGNRVPTKAVEIAFGGQYKTFREDTSLSVETLDIDTIISHIAYAGIFDLDLGPFDAIFMKSFFNSLERIVVNALEFSPFLLLEEKILSLHMEEITKALLVLQRLFTANNKSDINNLDFFICSNNRQNRALMRKKIMQNLGKEANAVFATGVPFIIGSESDFEKNHILLLKKLFSDEKAKYKNHQIRKNNTLVIRPSTLLAIYNAIFCKKPYIEKYVQVTLSEKDFLIVKAPIGLPLCYLIIQLASYLGEDAEIDHFFMENFIHREILFDFTTPVSKHFSHLFMLSDENFSHMYALLQKYKAKKITSLFHGKNKNTAGASE